MDQQYFGVSLEKLLTSGGQTLYMVAWSLELRLEVRHRWYHLLFTSVHIWHD